MIIKNKIKLRKFNRLISCLLSEIFLIQYRYFFTLKYICIFLFCNSVYILSTSESYFTNYGALEKHILKGFKAKKVNICIHRVHIICFYYITCDEIIYFFFQKGQATKNINNTIAVNTFTTQCACLYVNYPPVGVKIWCVFVLNINALWCNCSSILFCTVKNKMIPN